MENLKKQIIEKLEAAGFQVDMENVSWKKQETNTTGGATISINGQTFQQSGQQITVNKHFTILYECRVSDVGEHDPHDSLMCQFEVYEDDHKVQDLEINIYPDELDFFNNLSRKIFNI